MKKIKNAVVSVYDKNNLGPIIHFLIKNQVNIYLSQGSFNHVTQVLKLSSSHLFKMEELSGTPELFKGRLKTLGFSYFASLLFKRDDISDIEDFKKLCVPQVDLVICNFYPFPDFYLDQQEILQDTLVQASFEQVPIELIDIGGPAMVRAAAKNFKWVKVLTDPSQYKDFMIEWERASGIIDQTYSLDLARQAFIYTAQYEQKIADAFSLKKLRYGENPDQRAYICLDSSKLGFDQGKKLCGKEMSYNNYLDADAAWNIVADYRNEISDQNAVWAVVKHANPCGFASSQSALEALLEAWDGDSLSSFGGVLCAGQCVGIEEAQWLSQKFFEVLICPEIDPGALQILSQKKNLRILKIADFEVQKIERRYISGGHMVQTKQDLCNLEFEWATWPQTNISLDDVKFGVIAAKNVKSNAIVATKKTKTGFAMVGSGRGNPNRTLSVKETLDQLTNKKIKGNEVSIYSDAFFPFVDSLELLVKASVSCVFAPSGSIRDQEVIEYCNQNRLSLAFLSKRTFRH